MRLLHPRYGDERQGIAGYESQSHPEEAAYAIRNNICRCTGYVKIIDAILLAAELFRKGEVPPAPADWSLGQRVPRVDVEEKVTGTGIYPDDIYLDGMIYGSAVRSQYPRARCWPSTRRRPGPCPVWWGLYGGGHPRAEQGGPFGERLGHHDLRGGYHPLLG